MDKEKDKGTHYRYGMQCPSCREPINIDPYRVDKILGPMKAPAFHILKKIMRGVKKGHTEQQLVEEIICCAERWKEILQEDARG